MRDALGRFTKPVDWDQRAADLLDWLYPELRAAILRAALAARSESGTSAVRALALALPLPEGDDAAQGVIERLVAQGFTICGPDCGCSCLAAREAMTDLRAAVEGLEGRPTGTTSSTPCYLHRIVGHCSATLFTPDGDREVRLSRVLALIPEGAVLVTEAHEPEIHGHCDTEIVLGCLCGWRQDDGPWMDHLRETP